MNGSRRSSMPRWGKHLRFVCALLVMVAVAGPAVAEVAAPDWVRAQYVPDKNITGLAWKVVPGATSYQLLKSRTSGEGYKVIATIPSAMFIDKEAEPGETYYYALRALAGKEESPISKERMITIPGFKKVTMTPPTWSVAKANVLLDMGKKKANVALVWQRPEATNVVTFNLYRKSPSDADFVMLAAINDTKYTDDTVEIGKSYSYVMTSVDDSFTETERGETKTVEVKDVEIQKSKKSAKLVLSQRATKLVRRHKGGDSAKDGQVTIEIREPFDVVVDSKRELAFFSSTNTMRVLVFNFKGEFVRYIGKDGPPTDEGSLLYPVGMGIDKEGMVYVCDARRNDIQVFDGQGKFIRRIVPHKDEEMKEQPVPKDCAVAPDGTLYLLDYANHQVQVYDARGKYVTRFSKMGAEPGELRYPNYLALSNDGSKVIVINSGMSFVSVFGKDGKYLGQFGGKKNDVGQFVFIAGVALDAKDHVYVSDVNTNFIQVFNIEGQYLYSLGNETMDGAADVYAPRGMFIDGADRLYSTEGMIGRVTILQLLEDYKPKEWEPQGNAIGG